jgi:hypothetical protein
VASWLLTPPAKLTHDDRAALAQIIARCPELTTTRDLVREFADMLCNQRGEHLEAWASQAESSPVSELRGFSKGLRKDWAAVTAGLTTPYSSGAVEGHVNRIKMIKRQMYGRAKPDLLPQTHPARRLTVTESGPEPPHLAIDIRDAADLIVVEIEAGRSQVAEMGQVNTGRTFIYRTSATPPRKFVASPSGRPGQLIVNLMTSMVLHRRMIASDEWRGASFTHSR